tara:strand:+ start:460 stop:654 length:195 start_codon:yes stop_codon:yes gene_type:complete
MSSTADPLCPHCRNQADCIDIDMHEYLMFDGDQVQAYAQHSCQHCDKEFTVIWNMTIHCLEVEE